MLANTWKFSTAKLSKVEELTSTGFEKGHTIAWFGSSNFGPVNTAANLKKSWASQAGAFLFLKARWEEINKSKFKAKLNAFLKRPVRKDISFLWIENPLDPIIKWRTNSISTESAESSVRVCQLSFLDIHNYSLSLDQSTEINLKGSTFEFKQKPENKSGFEFHSAYSAHTISDIGTIRGTSGDANSKEKVILLPMKGAQAACLQFDLKIAKAGTTEEIYGYPDLEQLDIGMRIFFADPEFPESGDDFYLTSHRYPLLQEASTYENAFSFYPSSIDWKVNIDLLYPVLKQRTYFEFVPPPAPNLETGFPSAYRTNMGYTVHLLPKVGESRLVFANRPTTIKEQGLQKSSLYLTPSGKFAINIPKYSSDNTRNFVPEANIICGISGLEYLKVHSGFEINFISGSPGYAGSFLSINSLLRDFNDIQKQYQRSVWDNSGGPIRDLPESFDLDMEIEANDGLNISDDARLAMLNAILLDYFPISFQVSDRQREIYLSIAIVEDWIQWFKDQMKEATLLVARDGGLLGEEITTSWAYITGSSNAIYYAQPDNAALHMAERTSNDFLDFMEVPAMGLPNRISNKDRLKELSGSPIPAFPIMPYGNVDSGSLSDMRQMELLVLNPVRRKQIHQIGEAEKFSTPLTKDTSGNRIGTTPQGLIAKFSENWKTIKELQLAKDTKGKQIGFINILHGSPMKSALQSNQLFLVVSDPTAILEYFSNEKLKDFFDQHNILIENDLDIMDWVFELGPGFWNKKGTIMVFKYTDNSLLEMAGQPEQWFMPTSFNQDTQGTSSNLQQLLSNAILLGTGSDPKARRKYESLAMAASQPTWTGIILLNVHVPLRGLPDSLKALAGGMDPDLFYAKFIGIEVTQVKTSGPAEQIKLDPQESSIFALIDYENPEIPSAEPSGYNFHVPSLSIVFQNSDIVHFAAEILLILENIFDERARLLNSTNNIISLRGVAEEHNGKISYSFGFSGANRFKMSGRVLEEVEIIKAQFSTDPLPPKETRPVVHDIVGRFTLWGQIRYTYLRDFDILSFGRTPNVSPKNGIGPAAGPVPKDALSFSKLEITLSFQMDTEKNTVDNRKFNFDPSKIVVDIVRSGWRKQSLFEQFPLAFRGFVNVKTAPGAEVKTGYMPVSAPARRAKLGENYYAMKFDFKLGNLGALSGSKPLIAGILVAWNPGKEGIFVGLKLPGSSGDKREIVIQGTLKLAFRSIRFVVFDQEPIPNNETEEERKAREKNERKVGYLLNLKNIKLTFFMLFFPPIGQTEMTLFGDPREGIDRANRLLGWYASYVK